MKVGKMKKAKQVIGKKTKKASVLTVKGKKRVQREVKRDGSWAAVKDAFVALDSTDLKDALEGACLVCPKGLRPYLARTAKQEGITYFTLGIPDSEDMLVIRHEPLED